MGESADGPGSRRAGSAGLILGLATIYIVWGSTYLAIRVGIETIPPFLMAGTRFLIAGLILYCWARFRGARPPAAVHWRMAAVAGALLLLCGNGGVVWAEQYVPSNLAALLVTTMPLWMALCDWLRPRGVRPPLAVWLGLFAGFGGMVALVIWGKGIGGERIHPLGVAALIFASMTWAVGSVFTKHAPRPDSPIMTTALQMLAGGLLLMVASVVTGEWASFHPAQVSLKSTLGLVYLLIAGSLLTMTVYTWLLQVTEPMLISTYAFVNPVIAVLLGWLLADEALTRSTLFAGGVIVAAVAWLIAVQWRYSIRARAARITRRMSAPQEVSP